MFITVHGIDGTGKSTVANCIVEALHGQGAPTLTFDDAEKHYSPKLPLGPDVPSAEAASHPSLSKKAVQSVLVRAASEDGIHVVKDRWLIDVYADNIHKGVELPEPPAEIVMPDLSVILVCSEDIRRQRIMQRGNPTADDLIPKELGTRAQFFETYLLENIGMFASQSMVVDTGDHGPAQVAQQSVAYIGMMRS